MRLERIGSEVIEVWDWFGLVRL
ncbi:hypothetical protein C345_06676 [Cryptococcus neoformans A2-102-5]|nr:hypothetical protein C345_06676 [Cryptococcus neoformans var. grubii A2-102-5]